MYISQMLDDDVFKEITSKQKWYVKYCSEQYASNIKRMYREGKLSFKAMEKLFNHFGYFMNYSWRKKV